MIKNKVMNFAFWRVAPCALLFLIAMVAFPSGVRCEIPAIQDIVIHPDVLKIGGTARLLCMVANVVPGVTVFWSKVDTQNVISADGVIKADTFDEQSHIRKYDILVYKSDATSGVNIYELIIHKLQMLDGGIYKCHIYISGHVTNNQDTGRLAKLTIVVPPRINLEVMKPVVTAQLNEPEVKLICKASGQPTPNITWSRYAGLDAQGNKNIRFKDGSWIVYGEALSIKNVEQSDAGLYRCAAKNNVDPDDIEMAQYDIQLQVHYRPTSSAMQREVGQAPNKNYYSHLDCRIVGFPAPEMYYYKVKPARNASTATSSPFGALDIIYQIEGQSQDDCLKMWEIDQGPLKQTSELFLSHHQMPDSMDSWLFRLEIKNVRNSHYGYYMCTAQNALGASCAVVYFYETTHCQGTWCPNPLQPAQQLGAAFLTAPVALVSLLALTSAAAPMIGFPFR